MLRECKQSGLIVKNRCAERGITEENDLPHIHPHAFRYTAASMIIANGVDLVNTAAELGHANRTGLKASQCIDTRLEISHYERDVMPSLTIPPEDEKRAWREWKFSDSYLDTASKRTKVLDEIQRLKEVYDARLWRCCKDADEAVVDFIDKEVDKWLTSKNAATKTGD